MSFAIPIPLTLTPLGAADEDLLCGRAAEVEIILRNCEASRLTVITSRPGLGASSLLRAGAEPALRRANFITVVYSDWQGKFVAGRLREAIVSAVHEQADGGFMAESAPLMDVLTKAQAKTGRPIAVLLDQFEDYVRCHSGTEVADDFDAQLANAISWRAGRFVIALQTPSVAAFERLGQYIPNLMGFTIRLPPLTPDAAKQLVTKIAARSEIELEPAAIEDLVAAPTALVTAGPDHPAGVHPLFVRLGVERLCDVELVLKSTVGRASTLSANGGADRMIRESLDPAIQQLGVTHGELFFRLIPLLLSPADHRLAVSEKALVEHSGKWNRFLQTLLPMLIKSGLLRTVATQHGVRYEFGRESTCVSVRDWWVRAEARIVARQRAKVRVRSISMAVGAILLAYIIYLFTGKH